MYVEIGIYLEYYKEVQTLNFPAELVKTFTMFHAPQFHTYVRTSENVVTEIKWAYNSLTNGYDEVKTTQDDALSTLLQYFLTKHD